MTIPDRGEEDVFNLSPNATQEDLIKSVASAVNQSQGIIDNTLGNVPPVPSNLTASVDRDKISMSCSVSLDGINNVDYILYEIKRHDNTTVQIKGTYSEDYFFHRATDGYPEYTQLANWQIRAKSVSMYTDENHEKVASEWSAYVNLSAASLLNYGTWKIPAIKILKEVVDRTVIMTAVFTGTPQREVYGTPKLNVWISRVGNNDLDGNRTFNQILGVSPDVESGTGNIIWYTPEFNKSVQPSETEDTEKNYHEFDELGQPKTVEWVSDNYKISHTLPLIGQNARLYKNDTLLGFVFDVTDAEVPLISEETTVPDSPIANQIMLYEGTTTSSYENGKYYIYRNAQWTELTEEYVIKYVGSNSGIFRNGYYYILEEVSSELTWIELTKKTAMVPTTYIYKIQMFNESCTLNPGNISEAENTYVTALCTNISDIVHSHEHYKDLYVEKLSAINANIGMISQGGMGTFNENSGNYWALSQLSAEECGIAGGMKPGAFRVGGENEYFKVTPLEDGDYKIELKAGNIELITGSDEKTSSLNFQKGTYIYSNDRKSRLALSDTGIIAQVYKGTDFDKWSDKTKIEDLSKVIADPKGNMIITNKDEVPPFGFKVSGNVYHFEDSVNPFNSESGTNPQGLSGYGSLAENGNDSLVLKESSKFCYEGTVIKEVDSYEGNIVFLSRSEKIRIGSGGVDSEGNYEATYPAPLTGYNEAMREDSTIDPNKKVGEYLGLTLDQIDQDIFN